MLTLIVSCSEVASYIKVYEGILVLTTDIKDATKFKNTKEVDCYIKRARQSFNRKFTKVTVPDALFGTRPRNIYKAGDC